MKFRLLCSSLSALAVLAMPAGLALRVPLLAQASKGGPRNRSLPALRGSRPRDTGRAVQLFCTPMMRAWSQAAQPRATQNGDPSQAVVNAPQTRLSLGSWPSPQSRHARVDRTVRAPQRLLRACRDDPETADLSRQGEDVCAILAHNLQCLAAIWKYEPAQRARASSRRQQFLRARYERSGRSGRIFGHRCLRFRLRCCHTRRTVPLNGRLPVSGRYWEFNGGFDRSRR